MAPLFPSERKCLDGSCSRAIADVFRRSLAEAAVCHLPAWAGKLTPHVLRHFCASQPYLAGGPVVLTKDPTDMPLTCD